MLCSVGWARAVSKLIASDQSLSLPVLPRFSGALADPARLETALRLDKSPLWLILGTVALVLSASFLILSEADFAGRAYAAYSGVQVAWATALLWLAENVRPDHWDLVGAILCLAGCAAILVRPRTISPI
ncbi:MAG: YnfA family protein [Erythrobacter sp.]